MTLVMSVTAVVATIVYLLPPWYRAEAELLPPTEDDVGVGLSSLLRGIAVPGVRIPTQVTPVDVFMIVLQSRRINEQMVDRFNLKQLYDKKFTIDAINELRSHSRFELTQGGSIQISVEDKDRQRAADMTNAYVEFLDRFNRQVRITKGRRTRMFIETRLAETKRELVTAEQKLAGYQARHKTVALTPGMSSAIEEAARLYARRTSLQVRLGVIRNYSDGSEEEIQLRQELEQLDRQMRALPETGLELGRFVRDVKVQEQVFVLLTGQYEEARITEARDLVTVELLDVAKPPEKKSRPRRLLIVAAAFLLSLTLGAGLAMRAEREEPRPVRRVMVAE